MQQRNVRALVGVRSTKTNLRRLRWQQGSVAGRCATWLRRCRRNRSQQMHVVMHSADLNISTPMLIWLTVPALHYKISVGLQNSIFCIMQARSLSPTSLTDHPPDYSPHWRSRRILTTVVDVLDDDDDDNNAVIRQVGVELATSIMKGGSVTD